MELNKIYNMDCNVGLQQMIDDGNQVDIVLSSPPYNIILPNRSDRGYDLHQDTMSNEDYINWNVSMFEKFDKLLKKDGVVLWNMSYGGGIGNTEQMVLSIGDICRKTNFTIADIIIWEKPSATPITCGNKLTRICEFVYVMCRRNDFDTFNRNKKVSIEKNGNKFCEPIYNKIFAKNNDEHCDLNMATFSTEFCYKLMNIYAQEHYTILDPFMGTGTTALACYNRNMNYIGFELSQAQCEYANKRLENVMNQTSLFDLL